MESAVSSQWGYLVVWEFRVRASMEKRFEERYSPAGDWAQLFKQGEGYIGTELNRDLKDPRRYLTLDFWVSRQAYERFRAGHLEEYRAIDQRCEALTEKEVEIGRFERVS